jgi:hypothetical protein
MVLRYAHMNVARREQFSNCGCGVNPYFWLSMPQHGLSLD